MSHTFAYTDAEGKIFQEKRNPEQYLHVSIMAWMTPPLNSGGPGLTLSAAPLDVMSVMTLEQSCCNIFYRYGAGRIQRLSRSEWLRSHQSGRGGVILSAVK